jgi:DNA-binding transcriptional regulator LsrR (DeoR family)
MNQEPLTGKKKRMMEAARLRHMENNSNSEIADKLNLSTGTVENYFCDPEMQEFKRYYSDVEKFRLQQALEEDVKDATDLSYQILKKVLEDDNTKPQTLANAVNEAKRIAEREKKMLEIIDNSI